MFLYFCEYKEREWGAFIIEESRGKAKSLFNGYFGFCERGSYTDVRCKKIRSAEGYQPQVFDDDCPELEALGQKYFTEEEAAAMFA